MNHFNNNDQFTLQISRDIVKAWEGMVKSCSLNKTHTMCDQWRSLDAFAEWADTVKGPRKAALCIIGDDTHYSPETCTFMSFDAIDIYKDARRVFNNCSDKHISDYIERNSKKVIRALEKETDQTAIDRLCEMFNIEKIGDGKYRTAGEQVEQKRKKSKARSVRRDDVRDYYSSTEPINPELIEAFLERV